MNSIVIMALRSQVKTVDVAYDLKCEDAPAHYGHGYGKDLSKVTLFISIFKLKGRSLSQHGEYFYILPLTAM